MEDVKGILLKNPDIDSDNIRLWLNEFSEVLTDNEVIARFESIIKTLH